MKQIWGIEIGGFISHWSTNCEAPQHVSWYAKLWPKVPPSIHCLQAVRRTQLFVYLLRWCGASLPSHVHDAHREAAWLPGSPSAAMRSTFLL